MISCLNQPTGDGSYRKLDIKLKGSWARPEGRSPQRLYYAIKPAPRSKRFKDAEPHPPGLPRSFDAAPLLRGHDLYKPGSQNPGTLLPKNQTRFRMQSDPFLHLLANFRYPSGRGVIECQRKPPEPRGKRGLND